MYQLTKYCKTLFQKERRTIIFGSSSTKVEKIDEIWLQTKCALWPNLKVGGKTWYGIWGRSKHYIETKKMPPKFLWKLHGHHHRDMIKIIQEFFNPAPTKPAWNFTWWGKCHNFSGNIIKFVPDPFFVQPFKVEGEGLYGSPLAFERCIIQGSFLINSYFQFFTGIPVAPAAPRWWKMFSSKSPENKFRKSQEVWVPIITR